MGEDPVAQRFNRIFSSVKNHCRNGAILAGWLTSKRLHFSDRTDVIILSEIYEHLLKRVADDSPGWAGEFYTPRHIIRAMVRVVNPQLGDRIYDPCFGSAGFEAESADQIRKNTLYMSAADLERFQQHILWCRVQAAQLLARNDEYDPTWRWNQPILSSPTRWNCIHRTCPKRTNLLLFCRIRRTAESLTERFKPISLFTPRDGDSVRAAHHGESRRGRTRGRNRAGRRALPWRAGCEGARATAQGIQRPHRALAAGWMLPALCGREDERAVLQSREGRQDHEGRVVLRTDQRWLRVEADAQAD